MKYEMKRQKNGWLFKAEDEDQGIVCREDFENEHEAWKYFLYEILETYGPTDNRYSPKRVRVVIEAGDKYEGESCV